MGTGPQEQQGLREPPGSAFPLRGLPAARDLRTSPEPVPAAAPQPSVPASGSRGAAQSGARPAPHPPGLRGSLAPKRGALEPKGPAAPSPGQSGGAPTAPGTAPPFLLPPSLPPIPLPPLPARVRRRPASEPLRERAAEGRGPALRDPTHQLPEGNPTTSPGLESGRLRPTPATPSPPSAPSEPRPGPRERPRRPPPLAAPRGPAPSPHGPPLGGTRPSRRPRRPHRPGPAPAL